MKNIKDKESFTAYLEKMGLNVYKLKTEELEELIMKAISLNVNDRLYNYLLHVKVQKDQRKAIGLAFTLFVILMTVIIAGSIQLYS